MDVMFMHANDGIALKNLVNLGQIVNHIQNIIVTPL